MRPHAPLLAAALIACKPAPPPTAADAAPPPPAAEARAEAAHDAVEHHDHVGETTLFRHMVGHIGMLVVARDALIRGDAERAHAEMTELATHPLATGLTPAQEAMAMLTQKAAARAEGASTHLELAQAITTTAARCGDCHRAEGLTIQLDTPTPGLSQAVPHHMTRHVLALDRFWEGLVEPSDEAWKEGALALSEDAVAHVHVPHDPGRAHAVEVMGRFVHQMGDQALDPATPDGRAETLAQWMATCADCHAEAGLRR